MTFVFVYGTLKRGGKNHRKLLNSTFIGEGVTYPLFEMKNLGRAPGVVEGANQIRGEVFQIDSDTLHDLDQLERLGWVYERRETPIRLSTDIVCWIYVYKHKALASVLNLIYKSNPNVVNIGGVNSWNNRLP